MDVLRELRGGERGEGACEHGLAGDLALPLPAADTPPRHIGGQPVEQHSRRRHVVKPPAGSGLAYIDWCQQEFGIAAALSGDPNMLSAYGSGDPYLAFARQAGAAPQSATKQTHSGVREQFKACALAVQYGRAHSRFPGAVCRQRWTVRLGEVEPVFGQTGRVVLDITARTAMMVR